MDRNFFIHIGAPRTGTSFLRSEVFPRISNVRFSNKQLVSNETTCYFDELSHYGDGDELSIAMKKIIRPDFLGTYEGKILVSEEHLLWSVYHMFGNVGSRAMMLKQRFPSAKIILTIRRQPEFLLSVYSYLRSLKKKEFGNHLKSPWQFVNYAPHVRDVKVKQTFGIPSGLEWNEYKSTYDIGKNYFNRRARQFIAADFSWLSLYDIYEELFGHNNVLVLPQEIWEKSPDDGIELLEEFIGEKVDKEGIDFGARVNANDQRSKKEKSAESEFKSYIQELTYQDNAALDRIISYCDLDMLGYTQKEVGRSNRVSIGVGKPGVIVGERKQKALESIRQKSVRLGLFPTTMELGELLLRKLILRLKIKQRLYRLRRGFVDWIRGLDFERIESVDKLSLNPEISEQYEGSKIDELKELFENIELPERVRFLDLGSGKGRVVCFVSTLKDVDISRGVEISHRLCLISNKNISILGCKNCEIINSDVQDIDSFILKDSNVFYFYNPFPRPVLFQVLEGIAESVNGRKSGIVIIYFNPVDSDAVESVFMGRFRKKDYKNKISSAVTSVYWIE